MNAVTLVVPGPLETRTGGSIYDRRMAEELRRRGWRVGVVELDGGFPFPATDEVNRAREILAALPRDAVVLVDGLVFGAIPDVAAALAGRLRFVALVHLPLAAAAGLDPATATRLAVGEQGALSCASLVIATGAVTPALMAEHGLTHPRIEIVEPGTDRAPLARGSGGPSVHLLSVATVGPGKGHDLLLDALGAITGLPWRLTCAGSLTRYPETAGRVRTCIERRGLGDRIVLAGDLTGTELAALYDAADVFVLATLGETYGMAVAEALARGLPVVSTDTGAIASLVGDAAGRVVPPSDTGALTEALAALIGDRDQRARAAEGARRVRDRLPGWNDAAARMAAALESVLAHG
jgi:glycosyltransferase involved in cell wall biosynthesis